jgi:hypothetical protein
MIEFAGKIEAFLGSGFNLSELLATLRRAADKSNDIMELPNRAPFPPELKLIYKL